MIAKGETYMFTKSGNEVGAIEPAEQHLGKPCWVVERTKGGSAGKRMVAPEVSLVTPEAFALTAA